MKPEDVAESYDRLAERWASPTFNRENGISQHQRALRFVRPAGLALDVGCGSSGRLIDLLCDHGYEVEGLDLSRQMLRFAQLRHPRVHFYAADICSWEAPKCYDFISAWDSIWHVPLHDQRRVIEKLCSALKPGGVLIFTAGGLYTPGDRVDDAMGVPMYHATLGIPAILAVLQECGCMLKHFEYDQFPELHVYFIAQRA